jgi:hypothetical protein
MSVRGYFNSQQKGTFGTILLISLRYSSETGSGQVTTASRKHAGGAVGSLWAQDGASQRSVLLIIANYLEALYIETGFPTFLAMYHVLDGPKAPGRHYSLT